MVGVAGVESTTVKVAVIVFPSYVRVTVKAPSFVKSTLDKSSISFVTSTLFPSLSAMLKYFVKSTSLSISMDKDKELSSLRVYPSSVQPTTQRVRATRTINNVAINPNFFIVFFSFLYF